MSAKKINNSNYDSVKSEPLVLLDFYADWCGPCKMLSPIIDQIADENPDLVVGKVNVDESPDLARLYNVFNIPTLVVLKNGEIVSQASGARPKAQILAMLK